MGAGCDEVSRSYLEFFLKKFTAEVEPNDKVVLNNCKYHNTIKSSVEEKNVAKKLYKAFHPRFSQGREYLERKGSS
ncbi:hypothetical protein H5410_001009 [Solanum commersonii]|uniref:Uncharacterized protein n=1 Tax=Solanum commersonii TaxID=4109 RepID=A0A9J6AXV9_SOLCO|nr:hypothetical protein H5410_001009 [Solanum commersonii]